MAPAAIPGFYDVHPESILINHGLFSNTLRSVGLPPVELLQLADRIQLHCGCNAPADKLCEHQVQVLYNVLQRDELRVFFDDTLRFHKLRQVAINYGLDKESNPDDFFSASYHNKKLVIAPKMPDLFSGTRENTLQLQKQLLPDDTEQLPPVLTTDDSNSACVVLRQHKYNRHLTIELYEAPVAKNGKFRNPFTPVQPQQFIWQNNNNSELKFFAGITRFQQTYTEQKLTGDMEALKAVIRNPLQLPLLYHMPEVSDNITSSSVLPVTIQPLQSALTLLVNKQPPYYTLTLQLDINGETRGLQAFALRLGYFLQDGDTFYLIDQFHTLRLIEYFKQHNHAIRVHESQYDMLQQQLLAQLETSITVTYTYLQPATKEQLAETGFTKPPEKNIYLSEAGNYILIKPVVQYGEKAIPLRVQTPVYTKDAAGKPFQVQRNDALEQELMELFLKQHADFTLQLEYTLPYFYLHKDQFLNNDWFVEAYEQWQQAGFSVYGFNQLKSNKRNPNKIKVAIHVTSGLNWFNTNLNVSYGNTRASLKQIQRALIRKSRFIELDDGTLGMLPEEWAQQFIRFFSVAELAKDVLHTPKLHFEEVREIYQQNMLAQDVQEELELYHNNFSHFQSISEAPVPAALQAQLRFYQQEGLNWLNFLDNLHFGGILADDMGLGKTIQIIAFVLLLKEKAQAGTHLLVVPTSLVFNWQNEIRQFAPSLKVYTQYGANRLKQTDHFSEYDIVLTTYNTLLSDISFVKKYTFHYLFADESQNIKNIDSQRYLVIRQVKARNRILLTGTPLENNTFDIYGQLSITCPGLLGTRQYFRDTYAIPIDKFKDDKRAATLQQKIQPFILRRTKQEVAAELPDKTEMVLYCEMGETQRKIYDTYEKELREFVATAGNPEEDEDEKPSNTMHVLKGITKLRQICNSPALLPQGKPYANTSAKIEVLAEQIESKSPSHKILVFSQFVSMLDLIKQELTARKIGFAYLTGSTTNRDEAVRSFQEDAGIRVFLISLKAGGTGLNLTEADYVYIVDPWWNPAVENQAIDRSYRIGQQKNVVAVRLICPNTVEEKIMQLQESKRTLVSNLVGHDPAFFRSLTRTELLGLLRKE